MRTLRPHPPENSSTTPGAGFVDILDQTRLPYAVCWLRLDTLAAVAEAIGLMQVRGAPLIGVTAAYGVAIALGQNASDAALAQALDTLGKTRPTAVNLRWALDRLDRMLHPLPPAARPAAAWAEASAIEAEDVENNRAIGEHGLALLRRLTPRGKRLELMTHCNAGWLATAGWGTALSPIYAAARAGLELHVWVSETRPRNQGLLTAWELASEGIPHTLIADNAAGHLIAQGRVDALIVGADRIAANGDVANKVGTYMKALAAAAHGIPFYVAAPRATLDFSCPDGGAIPIETRSGDELRLLHGLDAQQHPAVLSLCPEETAIANPAFDVTPARFIRAIISERGVAAPSELRVLYPEEKT